MARRRVVFLLDQPLFRVAARKPLLRWQAITHDGDPLDEQNEKLTDAFQSPDRHRDQAPRKLWKRMNRSRLLAALSRGDPRLKRVTLVCGAGLGKTTNLQHIEAHINQHLAEGRGQQLAFFLEMAELPSIFQRVGLTPSEALLDHLSNRIANQLGITKGAMLFELRRRLKQGTITLLLDSLDQAGARPDGPAMRAFQQLLVSPWQNCSIWLSGRPEAFRVNAQAFPHDWVGWQFFRIAQFDEAEARYHLEVCTQATHD